MKDEELLQFLEKSMYQNNWTQEELAQGIGTSRATLWLVLQHRRKMSKRLRFKIEEFLKKYS